MKIASLTRVKIDGDIIEEFVRHTLRFVDRVVVVDNSSPDGTHDTLCDLQREGLPVTVLADDHTEVRAELMTQYAQQAFALTDADYLLLLDADEFVHVSSRARLEDELGAIPPGAHALVP